MILILILVIWPLLGVLANELAHGYFTEVYDSPDEWGVIDYIIVWWGLFNLIAVMIFLSCNRRSSAYGGGSGWSAAISGMRRNWGR